ncbi:MAG: hypothetical protein ACLGIA_09070 [Actinomycetes bacterium]
MTFAVPALSFVVQVAAGLVAAAALVSGALALVATRQPGVALAVLLDLLLAAGLLRLIALADWQAIIGAAAVVVIRKVVVAAYHRGSRVLTEPPTTTVS